MIGMERIGKKYPWTAYMWNQRSKRLLIAVLCVLILSFTGANLTIAMARRHFRRENQNFFAAFLGNVEACYPEIAEEEWVSLLNGTKHLEEGRMLLSRYGILEEDSTFYTQEQGLDRVWVISNIFLFLLGAGMGAVFFLYLWGGCRKVEGLTGYIRGMERGEYCLELQENREDELSFLQNELYKVMLLWKEQAERATVQRKALAESVSDISHQIKTPLTSAMVLLDNLSGNSGMGEATRKRFLQEITAQLTGLNWLVITLLKLSKLDAGVIEWKREQILFQRILRDVADKLEIQAQWQQVELSLEMPQEECLIKGDPRWIQEAVTNLVKNAIEHSPAGSCVELFLEDAPVYTRLRIQDHGEGIPLEEQRHIFERFYQGKTRRNTVSRDSNMGIGLALAKEIITKEGGYLTVESDGEHGATFVLQFLKDYTESLF